MRFGATAPIDDAETTFRAADHHLRELLFDDGVDYVGIVKGAGRHDGCGAGSGACAKHSTSLSIYPGA